MKIILTNGTELEAIVVTGSKRTVQGASRDTLHFVFPAETSLDEMDGLFTEENCETITIVEDENEYVKNGYTIRADLKRESVEVTPATDTEDAVYENRVTVAMAQRTYAEYQMAEVKSTLNALLNGEE